MKTAKRFLATIVAVMLVITSLGLPAFAAFTDLKEDSNGYDAANVLNMLGVINGYPDGSFGPEKNVTRAEFTAMLLRTRGMGSVGSTSLENPPFPDVTTSDVSWAIGNIRTARELGIINGYDDGTFKPNNNVSYEEAVKMIVCALGYGEMGAEGAFWYSKYLMTATSLGFLDGAGGAVAVPATRATIANMLYNCLEIKLAENNQITNKTILENDLKLTKNIGVIYANPEISLYQAEPSVRSDEVQIKLDSTKKIETYKVKDAAKYNDMLGAQITFYYTTDRESGLNTIISATVNDVDIVEIPSNMLVNNTGSSIEYYKNEDADRTTTVNIASDSVVVYNGKLYGSDDTDSSFGDYCNYKTLPSIGNIKLLDRNGDKIYDVVFIDGYTAWIVSGSSSTNETVTDDILRKKLGAEDRKLTLKAADGVKIVDANGNEVGFSAIKKNSVLMVKEDNHSGITAVVTNNTVTGKITATNSKSGVTINGKTYKFSKQAPWENGAVAGGSDLTAPQYGDSGKFFLDIEGNILAYDKTEAVVTQNYGYVTGLKDEGADSFEEALKIQILTKSNPKGKIYGVTTKTKIGTQTYSNLADAKTALETAISTAKGVKFTVGKNDELDEIIPATVSSTGNAITADTLYVYRDGEVVKEDTRWTYNTSRSEFTNTTDNSKKIHIGGVNTILCVEDNEYKTMSSSNFRRGVEYEVVAYDMSETGSAKFLIVYKIYESAEFTKANASVVYVDNVDPVYDSATGETTTTIKGYRGKSEVSYKISDENTIDPKKGDVIRVNEKNGEYTVESVIFRVGQRGTSLIPVSDDIDNTTENLNNYKVVEFKDYENTKYRAIWGSAKTLDTETGGRFIMTTNVLATGSGSVLGEETLEKSWFSNAKIIQYNTADNEFEDRTNEEGGYESILMDLNCKDKVAADAKPTELFVYMNSPSSVYTVVIVN